jgi:hypothetical protein
MSLIYLRGEGERRAAQEALAVPLKEAADICACGVKFVFKLLSASRAPCVHDSS